MEVAVLILTRGRCDMLEKCLESLKSQKGHGFTPRFYILINGKDSETETFLKNYHYNYYSFAQSVPVGEARNFLIEKVKEPLICFLDDDVELPQNYFQKASAFISKFPEVDIFGGPDENPCESTSFQHCLGMVMQSFIATGPTRKRHKQIGKDIEDGDEINLTLCNFWAKRDVFGRQMFPKHFRRNEENYLLSVLKDSGVVMRRVPHMFVYHNRKTSLYEVGRVLFLAGIYRVVSMLYFPKSIKLYFFLHQLFVVTLLFTLFFYSDLFVLLVFLYLATIGLESLRIAIKTKRPTNAILSILLFLIFNFAYPAGQILGYFKSASYFVRGVKL